MGSDRDRFYGGPAHPLEAGVPPDLDLPGAARLDGLAEEVALLRALIKRSIQTNRDDEARRQVQALCAALRLQRSLVGESDDGGRRTVDRVLRRLGREEAMAGGVR